MSETIGGNHLKMATMHDASTMLEKLVAANPISHLRERFYPKLLKVAGHRMNGAGVLLTVQLAICDYTDGMPPLMARMMEHDIDSFVDAMTDDEDVRQDAKRVRYLAALEQAR